ncbi:MAG: HEAT repeat domain-containing protein [Anaerolineaceae bacterium]|nr:HEAT repeat domain-containing protein [Anaerolineaceae bacterium]
MDVNIEFSADDIIENLLDDTGFLEPHMLPFFSDISYEELEIIKEIWHLVSIKRKLNLLSDLKSLMEEDTLISCDDFGIFALQDENPHVRSQAVHLLWECYDTKLISTYIRFLKQDPNPEVNASAASALGKYVLLGELDDIPDEIAEKVFETLINEFTFSKHDHVKQRILESLGYSSDEKVINFIADAIRKPDKEWQLAALCAIGRSANDVWEKEVVNKLRDTDPEIKIEAIKAAGELEITSAKNIIKEILLNASPEEDIRLQSIWALSKIGGNDIKIIFNTLLENTNSEEEANTLEMAIENLDLVNAMTAYNFNDDDNEP